MALSTLIVCCTDARQLISVTRRDEIVWSLLRTVKMNVLPNRRAGTVSAAAAVAGRVNAARSHSKGMTHASHGVYLVIVHPMRVRHC